jgi:hypothetical protein
MIPFGARPSLRCRRRWRAAAAALLLSIPVASCAPHRVAPPELSPFLGAERYRAALVARAELARVLDAEASAWLKVRSLRDLPGVHARLALGAPDALRVRVESAFGVGLDAAAWGESLACFLPARKLGVMLDAAADTLDLRAPGALGCRILGAIWDPGAAAWATARFEDSLLVVRWEEEGDSLGLGIGSDGLPRWAQMRSARGAAVIARYRAWEFVERTAWPARIDLADIAGGFSLVLRFTHLARNRSPAPGRLAVRVPASAARLEWEALRNALAPPRGAVR